MITDSFKNINYKLWLYEWYIQYMYKQDLALINQITNHLDCLMTF